MLKLDDLKVQSFVTALGDEQQQAIKGGNRLTGQSMGPGGGACAFSFSGQCCDD